jgi:2-oxoglutarate dehydrogenase E2 component (dihydrolipoamide succinyltransferase)
MRRRIAERLVQSQQTAALLTTFNEIDMSAVMAVRKEYQETFVKKYDIKLGFMSFFVKAAVEALKLIPQVNAEVRGETVVYKNYFDIGVAVGGGKGLVVPVIRSAESLSFAEVEQTISEFGKRARDNKLELHELEGGTFTISCAQDRGANADEQSFSQHLQQAQAGFPRRGGQIATGVAAELKNLLVG